VQLLSGAVTEGYTATYTASTRTWTLIGTSGARKSVAHAQAQRGAQWVLRLDDRLELVVTQGTEVFTDSSRLNFSVFRTASPSVRPPRARWGTVSLVRYSYPVMSDQIQDRRAKLARLRELGVDPYGSRFTGVTANRDIRALAERLPIEAGQILDAPKARLRAAGRVALLRDTGKLIFLTVRDRTGELQWALSRKTVEEGPLPRRENDEGRSETAESATAGPAGGAGLTPHVSPLSSSGGVAPGEAPWPAGPTAWQAAKLLDLGDIVGAEGQLGRTRTGELTLWVSRFRVLAKALRPPPEKRLGLTDVETRYRKRHVDLLANPASRDLFITRARIIDYIRGVLRERGFIEVETPVLQPIYGGAAARPFVTHHNALDMKLYLRISPELYLKRCLVGGLERVYEFSRCFRNEGISPRHNPEFTMLELYQAYGDYHDMMDITEAIIAGAARDVIGSYKVGFEGREIDYTPPWPRRRYGDLLREYAGVEIHDAAAVVAKARAVGVLARLQRARAAVARGADPAKVGAPGMEQSPHPSSSPLHGGSQADADADGEHGADRPRVSPSPGPHPAREGSEELHVDHALLVNALFEECVESHLINPTFVIDYPAPLCPLTRRHPDDPALALRFEAYVSGMEMGNAYSELNDPDVQRANLAAQVEGEGDETMRVMDDDFVEALEFAMPPAGGLGIGIDRLCMLLTGAPSIREVLLFPLQRPEAGSR